MNSELLRKVADYIEDDPRRYNQSAWFEVGLSYDIDEILNSLPEEVRERFLVEEQIEAKDHWCKTHACIAGNAAILAGKVKVVLKDRSHWMQPHVDMVLVEDFVENDYTYYAGEEAARCAGALGREVLELTEWQSAILFSGDWRPVILDESNRASATAQALRRLADGALISEVTDWRDFRPKAYLVTRIMERGTAPGDYADYRWRDLYDWQSYELKKLVTEEDWAFYDGLCQYESEYGGEYDE